VSEESEEPNQQKQQRSTKATPSNHIIWQITHAHIIAREVFIHINAMTQFVRVKEGKKGNRRAFETSIPSNRVVSIDIL
jgi:hypothetical protein